MKRCTVIAMVGVFLGYAAMVLSSVAQSKAAPEDRKSGEISKPEPKLNRDAISSKRVVLRDALDGKTSGKQEGGKFVVGGWTAVGANDRIVWELPQAVRNGCFEVEIRNLDLPKQVSANKNNYFGLWETLWASGGNLNKPNMDNINFRIGKNYPQFKVELHTHGICFKEKPLAPLDKGFDPAHTYRLKIEWINGVVGFSLDDKMFYVTDSPTTDTLDCFRYVHIGSDPQFKGATAGPICSNVTITEYALKP
ncbi:MAG: hypothetical protein N3D11_17335 [Candidatus Sumerlaeia bacterium]|nr:hypothetical protein [Candidatus Sumerlaeia bacterium]